MPPRPDSLYGAFKVYGETILRNYFDRHGIRSVSMRIGTYPHAADRSTLAGDLAQPGRRGAAG